MFCYVYGDYFGLFAPGLLAKMNQGLIAPFGRATDNVLIGVSLMMALPSTMIFLSVALPARLNRLVNITVGVLYSAIITVTMWAGPKHFLVYGVIEITLTLFVIYHAARWPKVEQGPGAG
jgi:hypothetical protein